MNIVINITELSSVPYTLELIKNLSRDFNINKIIIIAYRRSIKNKLNKLYTDKLIEVIYTQGEIGLGQDDELSSEENEKIFDIEKMYSNKSIWNYVYQDRFLIYTRNGFLYDNGSKFSRNKLLSTIINRFIFIENIFQKYQPDLVLYITQDFGTSISTILFEVAKKMNVPTLIPIISKFEGYFSLNDDIYGRFGELEELFHQRFHNPKYKVCSEIKILFKNYLQSNSMAFYVQNEKPNNLKLLSRKAKTLLSLLTKINSKEIDLMYIPKNKYIVDKLTMHFRSLKIKRNIKFSKFSDIKDVKFIFFPLHLEPELVLLVQSQGFIDQLNVIKNISKNLPDNIQLLVKDHPVADGRRKLSFFRQLNGIPNVILVDSKENSIDIINRSIGVITIIGSAGLEGFLFGKPVLTLSEAFYNFLPSVTKVENYEEIPDLVKNFLYFKSNIKEQLIFLEALIDSSVDVNLLELINKYHLGNLSDSELVKFNVFYDFLKDKIVKNAFNLGVSEKTY